MRTTARTKTNNLKAVDHLTIARRNNKFSLNFFKGTRVRHAATRSMSVGSSLGARELFTRRDTGQICR